MKRTTVLARGTAEFGGNEPLLRSCTISQMVDSTWYTYTPSRHDASLLLGSIEEIRHVVVHPVPAQGSTAGNNDNDDYEIMTPSCGLSTAVHERRVAHGSPMKGKMYVQ